MYHKHLPECYHSPYGCDDSSLQCVQLYLISVSLGFTDENYCHLHVNSDMQVIVKALASADSGLDVRDRMWLKITIPNAFIGTYTIHTFYLIVCINNYV